MPLFLHALISISPPIIPPRVTFSHDSSTGRKQREVSRAEAEQFAKEEGLLFLEASAKTGENVDRVRCSVCFYGFYSI